MTYIIGCDQSLSCTALVKHEINQDYEIIDTKIYFTTHVKKYNQRGIINPIRISKGLKGFEKAYAIYKLLNNDMFPRESYFALEAGSFASAGQLFTLGSLSALIQCFALESNMKVRTYEPQKIKMVVTGKGSGDKIPMYNEFCRLSVYDESIQEVLKYFPKHKPMLPIFNDIVDAYFISMLLLTEVKLRKGVIMLKDLPESTIKAFNTVTKANPVNLLGRGWICENFT